MLKNTQTAKNLMRSFAGESEARNRYTFYADVAKKEGYVQIYNIFTETANQEKAHAKIFFDILKTHFQDEEIEIDAAYPVALHDNTLKNLQAAAAGEQKEGSDYYPEFAKIARSEGFEEIAMTYDKISEVEKGHERRYRKLIESMQNNEVFTKEEIVRWKCNNCGHIHKSEKAPETCPVCSHPQGYFELFVENY